MLPVADADGEPESELEMDDALELAADVADAILLEMLAGAPEGTDDALARLEESAPEAEELAPARPEERAAEREELAADRLGKSAQDIISADVARRRERNARVGSSSADNRVGDRPGGRDGNGHAWSTRPSISYESFGCFVRTHQPQHSTEDRIRCPSADPPGPAHHTVVSSQRGPMPRLH